MRSAKMTISQEVLAIFLKFQNRKLNNTIALWKQPQKLWFLGVAP